MSGRRLLRAPRVVNAGGVALAIVATCALAHTPASAFTYVRIGDGSSQYMAWLWEWNPPVTSCLNAFPPSPCGNAFATDGQIPMSFHSDTRTVAGGSLSWSLSPGTLKIAAFNRLSANATSAAGSYAGVWCSIDAKSTPLDFVLVAQAGDPPVVDLGISPFVDGLVSQKARALGSEADVQYQYTVTVRLDGQLVVADSLYTTYQVPGPDSITYTPALPRGSANSIVIPAVAPGSEISIRIWAYMRIMNSGLTTTSATSAYGAGPALGVVVQAANVVGVPGAEAPARLGLRARPNPTDGARTIAYVLPRAGEVRLSIYDVAGHRVATLADRSESAGPHEAAWNGRDDRGRKVAAGVYLLELVAGRDRAIAKMVVLGR